MLFLHPRHDTFNPSLPLSATQLSHAMQDPSSRPGDRSRPGIATVDAGSCMWLRASLNQGAKPFLGEPNGESSVAQLVSAPQRQRGSRVKRCTTSPNTIHWHARGCILHASGAGALECHASTEDQMSLLFAATTMRSTPARSTTVAWSFWQHVFDKRRRRV